MADILQPHEFANLFPMMTEKEYQELLDSMRQDGYHTHEPILLYDGKILDGRNRYKAALELNILPMFSQFVGDDESAYNSAKASNMTRKHWSADQWSMIAQDLLPFEQEQAKKRMAEGGGDKKSGSPKQEHPIEDKGKSAEKVGRAIGVSKNKIYRATEGYLSMGAR